MEDEQQMIAGEQVNVNVPSPRDTRQGEPGRLKKLRVPAALLLIFWMVAITLWQRTGRIFFLFDLGYIGTSLGVGTGLYELLPRQKRPIGRRLAQFLIGVYMVGFL